jgi:hypothetical protein
MMRRPGLVVALMLLVACVDPAGPEDRFGQLRLRATFATGEAPAEFGVAVDSMRVVIERLTEEAPLVDTVIAWAEGEVSTWLLDLLADEEQLSVDMELKGGAAMLYQGTTETIARAGDIGETDIQGVPVLYRGPPPTDSVAVDPGTSLMTARGDSIRFTARALARDGVELTGKTFGWSSSDPDVATVDEGGLVTAVADGVAEIRATVDGVVGAAAVTVQVAVAAGLSTLEATPDDLPADGSSAAAVIVRLFDGNGNPLGKSGGVVTLATTLGSLSGVEDQGNGTYTALLTSTVVGSAVVTGMLDGTPIPDSAVVTFGPGPASPLTSILRADPDRVKDLAKGTVIRVRLFDAQGNRLRSSGGTVTLATTLGTLGPVVDKGDGTYRATLQSSVRGMAVITGTLNGVPMTASDTVRFVGR